MGHIHEHVTHHTELPGGQWFSKEVRIVVDRVDVRDADPHVLNHLADEEMTPLDVLDTRMVFGVVCKITRRGVIAGHGDRFVTFV